MSEFAEQLTVLFESDLADPHLVLREGRPEVAPAPDPEDATLVIASRADLLERCGGRRPSGAALDELAAALETSVGRLGG